MKIAIINGPNLNLLGIRETSTYGTEKLQDIMDMLEGEAKKLKAKLTFQQSNHEGELVDFIQSCHKKADFIVINPAAYTHTSIAIRDALLAVNIPFVEVHISNVYKREDFRQHSFLSDIAQAVISGCGILGYKFALEVAVASFKKNQ